MDISNKIISKTFKNHKWQSNFVSAVALGPTPNVSIALSNDRKLAEQEFLRIKNDENDPLFLNKRSAKKNDNQKYVLISLLCLSWFDQSMTTDTFVFAPAIFYPVPSPPPHL